MKVSWETKTAEAGRSIEPLRGKPDRDEDWWIV